MTQEGRYQLTTGIFYFLSEEKLFFRRKKEFICYDIDVIIVYLYNYDAKKKMGALSRGGLTKADWNF